LFDILRTGNKSLIVGKILAFEALNEMYNFIENAEYIFPYKWFGDKGPLYNIDDLMLNYKFHVINYDYFEDLKYDVVSTLHICNFSATAQTVNVYIVPSGTEANSTNIIYSNVSIASYNTYVVDKEKFILSNNDSIRANANSASTVSVSVTYTGM
jgi:hypothetical protein